MINTYAPFYHGVLLFLPFRVPSAHQCSGLKKIWNSMCKEGIQLCTPWKSAPSWVYVAKPSLTTGLICRRIKSQIRSTILAGISARMSTKIRGCVHYVRVACMEGCSWLDPGHDHGDGVTLIIHVCNCDPTPRNELLGRILVNWVINMRKQSCYHALICHLPDQNRLKFDKVVMVSTWWHPSIVIKLLWRKLPLEQRKSNFFKEEGMPISINIIACLECSCPIWVIGLFWQNTSSLFLTFLNCAKRLISWCWVTKSP
jgi:hypothetical protein